MAKVLENPSYRTSKHGHDHDSEFTSFRWQLLPFMTFVSGDTAIL